MKPCDAVHGLPCAGAEGTCFGRTYWGGDVFSEESGKKNAHKRRRKRNDVDECPWEERISAWWDRSEAILGPGWTPADRIAWEASLRAEPYKPYLRGRCKEVASEKYMEEQSE